MPRYGGSDPGPSPSSFEDALAIVGTIAKAPQDPLLAHSGARLSRVLRKRHRILHLPLKRGGRSSRPQRKRRPRRPGGDHAHAHTVVRRCGTGCAEHVPEIDPHPPRPAAPGSATSPFQGEVECAARHRPPSSHREGQPSHRSRAPKYRELPPAHAAVAPAGVKPSRSANFASSLGPGPMPWPARSGPPTNSTRVPFFTMEASVLASQLVRRTQPCE